MAQDPDSPAVRPAAAAASPGPRLIERLREAIRARHYSRRTQKSHWYWIRWYVRFHGMRHPQEMGGPEVSRFLSFLATERNVAAATQNQALSALLFLYSQVLGQELPWLDGVTRAKRPVRVPAVLTPGEMARLLAQLSGTKWLMASLLYGSGIGPRHPHGAGAARALGGLDDDDLHPRHEPRRARREEPAGSPCGERSALCSRLSGSQIEFL